MDVRVDGFYERMLLKLAELHYEPTASAMMRHLIKNAAIEVGLWEVQGEIKVTEEPLESTRE